MFFLFPRLLQITSGYILKMHGGSNVLPEDQCLSKSLLVYSCFFCFQVFLLQPTIVNQSVEDIMKLMKLLSSSSTI